MSTLRFTVMIPPGPSVSGYHTHDTGVISPSPFPDLSVETNKIKSRAVPGAFVPSASACVVHPLSLLLYLTHKAKLLELTCIMRRQEKHKIGRAHV